MYSSSCPLDRLLPMGVPFLLLPFAALPVLAGLPLFDFEGVDSSAPFRGTLVDLDLALAFCNGLTFSASESWECGSASTVTFIFHGLDPLLAGVSKAIDFEEVKRRPLLDLWASGVLLTVWVRCLPLVGVGDNAIGSGDEERLVDSMSAKSRIESRQ